MKRQRVIETRPLRAAVLSSPPARVSLKLSYDVRDPYAVQLHIDPGGPPIIWTFARDLLATGAHRIRGEGDVIITPALDGKNLLVRLNGDSESCLLRVPRAPVRKFLKATYDVVPVGRERRFLDIDHLVAQLMRA